MHSKNFYLALTLLSLTVTTASMLVDQEQNSTPSPSEQRAITILKEMSQFLAKTGRFSVTIRDGSSELGPRRIVITYKDDPGNRNLRKAYG